MLFNLKHWNETRWSSVNLSSYDFWGSIRRGPLDEGFQTPNLSSLVGVSIWIKNIEYFNLSLENGKHVYVTLATALQKNSAGRDHHVVAFLICRGEFVALIADPINNIGSCLLLKHFGGWWRIVTASCRGTMKTVWRQQSLSEAARFVEHWVAVPTLFYVISPLKTSYNFPLKHCHNLNPKSSQPTSSRLEHTLPLIKLTWLVGIITAPLQM